MSAISKSSSDRHSSSPPAQAPSPAGLPVEDPVDPDAVPGSPVLVLSEPGSGVGSGVGVGVGVGSGSSATVVPPDVSVLAGPIVSPPLSRVDPSWCFAVQATATPAIMISIRIITVPPRSRR